ncbi:MAG: CBS domain-containing protein [Pseudomonadota bacterium]
MKTIAEVMTPDAVSIAPRDSVRRAAQLMSELNVGSLPVCDGKRLVGMITDRDIVVRAISAGLAPDDTRIEQVMSEDVHSCTAEQSVDDVLQQMGDLQIRRVPVIDAETENLVGIVSLGDLAIRQKADIDEAFESISTPSEPDRS